MSTGTRRPWVISAPHLMGTCLMGQGPGTCSFLTMSQDGMRCAKGSAIEMEIRRRRAEGTMIARGDNCEGWDG